MLHLSPLLLTLGVAVGLPPQPADTLRIGVAEAFERAMASAPEVAAATLRAEAASARLEQAGRLPNLELSMEAENLGQQLRTTGFDGARGVEGQVVLSPPIPFGPTRSGSIGVARAEAAAARAEAERTRHEAAEAVLATFGELARAHTRAENARRELETLSTLADALSLQSEEGRAAASDASRAVLARGIAATELARREGELARAVAEVVRRTGQPADGWVELDIPACGVPTDAAATPADPPELASARAVGEAVRSEIDVARGRSRPDLVPGVGLRRAQGANALFLSLRTTLPLFDLGRARVDAARREAEAVDGEIEALEARLAAERAAAGRALAAVEAAGAVFDDGWSAALEQTLAGAELRYELGEGTLYELLDSRRARLAAADDYATWLADWWRARARLARLSGRPPGPALICTDPPLPENRP